MTDLPPVRRLLHDAPSGPEAGRVVLRYDERILRRKRLHTTGGDSFLVDFPTTLSLDGHAGFELEDGTFVRIENACEALLRITGDLPRFAWHIGNRHTPAEFGTDHILIREDHVLLAMLQQLGATVERVSGPFTAEGGAYGHGRTMGHAHGPETHALEDHIDPGSLRT